MCLLRFTHAVLCLHNCLFGHGHALQHFTDLKELKRTIVNTHAIDSQGAARICCAVLFCTTFCLGIIACLGIGFALAMYLLLYCLAPPSILCSRQHQWMQ
jgi:hypothetical protein